MIARQVIREIKIMRKLSSLPGSEKCVTQLLDFKSYEDCDKMNVILVMNYIGTSLERFFKANEHRYREKHVKQIIYSLLKSLNFIHKANIMHRDIKPANLLLTEDLDVVICDFGLARTIRAQDQQNDVVQGNRE